MENSIITSKYLHKKFKKSAPTIITISTETQPQQQKTNYERIENDRLPDPSFNSYHKPSAIPTKISAIPERTDVPTNSNKIYSAFDPSTKNSVNNNYNSDKSYDQVASISTHSTPPRVPTISPQQSSIPPEYLKNQSQQSPQSQHSQQSQQSKQSQDISDNNGFILKWELSSSTTQQTQQTDTNTVTIRINDDVGYLPTQHPPAQGKYVCPYCNLPCAKPSVLQKHIRAHTNERPFPCVSCGFSFKTKSNLYKHCRSRSHANRAKDSPEVQEVVKEERVNENLQPKVKPYKPKFRHNSYELENIEDGSGKKEVKVDLKQNTDLLKQHINNLITKNQSILENNHKIPSKFVEHDEPLNLTARNRKRCMSETEHSQKSLIKELLLKNLTQEQSYVCQFCKISFKNIENFEIHRKKYCKVGENPTSKDIALVRSHSVNVASVLTQKYSRNNESPTKFMRTTLPLKSPGPYLGTTSLINDKPNQVFYENRNPTKIHHAAIIHQQVNQVSPATPVYKNKIEDFQISAPYLPSPKKHNPIKLFGGEVKITETSGETRSFKIDAKNSSNDFPTSQYLSGSYPIKVSENSVIKSSLQSGGTMLQNYEKSQQFNMERPFPSPKSEQKTEYDRPFMDFNQKMFAPNIKQPSLTVPGIPVPNKVFTSPKRTPYSDGYDPPSMLSPSPSWNKYRPELSPKENRLYDPLNILINGKMMRYVPGMPGPENPIHINIEPPNTPKIIKTKPFNEKFTSPPLRVEKPSPIIQHTSDANFQFTPKPKPIETSEPSEPSFLSTSKEVAKPNKFLRPNSLSLKPHAIKTHHGLTPTVFNQALISPDTPRVAKKYCQLYLNGNCFTYLGLKSSTKPTYCTLNKTQPFYVQSFGTLSMYSQWRHLECKMDFVRLDTYDSRQRISSYTMAQTKMGSLVVDSSYKPLMIESSQKKEDSTNRGNILPGGYESNEDYTYIRGRGRGKYVCDQCGIRCKKPSMLKKHIRTHSDVRPYTCEHCNFSFKTKGNLTKHLKSKAHYKRTSISTSDSNGETQASQCSGTPSDDDSESDGENDSDDSTRLQDHEAAHCLLSLSQNRSPARTDSENANDVPSSSTTTTTITFTHYTPQPTTTTSSSDVKTTPNALENMSSRKPLTYPYVKIQTSPPDSKFDVLRPDLGSTNFNNVILGAKHIELFNRSVSASLSNSEFFSPAKVATTPTKIQFIADKLPNADVTIANYQQKFVKYEQERAAALLLSNSAKSGGDFDGMVKRKLLSPMDVDSQAKKRLISPSSSMDLSTRVKVPSPKQMEPTIRETRPPNIQIYEQRSFPISPQFPRHQPIIQQPTPLIPNKPNIQSRNLNFQNVSREFVENRNASARDPPPNTALDLSKITIKSVEILVPSKIPEPIEPKETPPPIDVKMCIKRKVSLKHFEEDPPVYEKTLKLASSDDSNDLDLNPHNNNYIDKLDNSSNGSLTNDPSTSQSLQTLAEIATKRVTSTGENTKLAQSVATEYLKIAKNETAAKSVSPGVIIEPNPVVANGGGSNGPEISDLIVKNEENKSCTICAKNFSKPSQLRLHMNIHYIERPFRCESCSVSFRSKGHLQKHERSASHHNKLSSSPTTSSSEPRPFKCSDCNIAFRIHGHLAKHLRSKMHIMRLECLARVPFGLYAELERANSLLTEINTTDCDMCLQSLKILARKLFSNDPNKLVQIEHNSNNMNNVTAGNKDQQVAVGSP